jgi:hypothetical protein
MYNKIIRCGNRIITIVVLRWKPYLHAESATIDIAVKSIVDRHPQLIAVLVQIPHPMWE